MVFIIMFYFFKIFIKKDNLEKDVVIFIVIFGDIGKVVFEGFKDIDKIKIIVFFLEDGVSLV